MRSIPGQWAGMRFDRTGSITEAHTARPVPVIYHQTPFLPPPPTPTLLRPHCPSVYGGGTIITAMSDPAVAWCPLIASLNPRPVPRGSNLPQTKGEVGGVIAIPACGRRLGSHTAGQNMARPRDKVKRWCAVRSASARGPR